MTAPMLLLLGGLLLLGTLLVALVLKLRRSEAQLVASESRWKYALEGAGDGVWDWNIKTNEVLFSTGWKTMLGYTDAEIGNDFTEWYSRVHEDDREAVLADIRAYLAGDHPSYVNEHRMRCKDGSWKWILDRGMVVSFDADGSAQRMVGTHTDISRHKQLEKVLQQNENELQTIFSQSPDGIVVFDNRRAILHVNEAFCRITGLARDRLAGATETEFDAMMQELCGDKSRYPATANQPDPAPAGILLKVPEPPRRRASDRGEHIDIFNPEQRVLLRSLIELDQERLSRVMYFRDVTAEVLVDRMKSEFLSTAAHELRTPMSIILGYAELLKLRSFDKGTEIQMVDSIHDQSQSIVTLLNELLDLARIEARAGKAFNMSLQPLTPVIAHLAETFMMPGDVRKVKLQPLPELPELMIDQEKIGQALKNCLSNAFKFSDGDSEVRMEVSLTGETDHPEVAIVVRDHGIGMTPQQLERMFEKFYRVDSSGRIPGTGLGMSLIKEIIEHHGGHVKVESAFGQGTVVTLLLPLQKNKIGMELS